MTEFMWGVVVGAVGSPFAWEGLKWCFRKLKEVLDKNQTKYTTD